jgi:endonuclease/exonuclease/phosphatase family metal-dependent hydrolase
MMMDLEPPAIVRTDAAEISVLTYNVRGLPWPVATGRGEALRAIGEELAELRRAGRQPDVVLIQEGFRSEMSELVRASGYAYWAEGPGREDRAIYGSPPKRRGANPLQGEGVGKLTGAGLHVLSDAPILDVRFATFRHCAGLDCLANKGAILVRIAPDGLPTPVDVVNTHLNSRKASRAPSSRTLEAHQGQTRELLAFLAANRNPDHPLIVGGDFNIRNSAVRYDFAATERPYRVVAEFCARVEPTCGAKAKPARADGRPWLASQILQGFDEGVVRIRPLATAALFDAGAARLSDHDGYLVRYRLSWPAELGGGGRERAALEVRPRLGAWGVKVSWRP